MLKLEQGKRNSDAARQHRGLHVSSSCNFELSKSIQSRLCGNISVPIQNPQMPR